MNKVLVGIGFMLILLGGRQPAGTAQTDSPDIRLEEVVTGLDQPIYLTHAGGSQLYIVEQEGQIRVAEADGQLHDEPFLDIHELVGAGGERGLLSVAFDPDFEQNGFFYVDYTDVNGDTVVARYQAADLLLADPASAFTILTVDQPAANHNGGLLVFGPDGYLYVGLGDGGGGNSANGQRMDTVLGKILRIDVNGASEDTPYAIPSDNPFVSDPVVLPEIWISGLRNPWRFSFDRATGDFYLGDVGSSVYEEINFVPSDSPGGENFGWPIMEGTDCREDGIDCSGLITPITLYDHSLGCTVVGGYVYRGEQYSDLQGQYLFGDYCSGRIWSVDTNQSLTPVVESTLLLESGLRISSFGEDAAGELYVIDRQGAIYRITSVETD